MNRTEKEDELCKWTEQIKSIAYEIHQSQMRNDFSKTTGTAHFANLLKFNIERIEELSAELAG